MAKNSTQQERFNIHITLWFESCSHITGILQQPLLLTKCKSLFGQGCHHRYIWFLSSPFAVHAVINDLSNEWFPSWDPELPTHKSQGVLPSYVEVFPLKVLNQQPGQRMFWWKDYLVPCLKGYWSFVQVATDSYNSFCKDWVQGKKWAVTRQCPTCLKILILLLEQFNLSYLAQGE